MKGDRRILQHFLGLSVARRTQRDADRRRREDLPAIDVEGRAQHRSETFRDANRIAGVIDVVEKHCELVSVQPRQRKAGAVARDDVRRSKIRLQALRDRHDQLVGAQHAKALIECLESVEAQDEDRENVVAASLGPLDGALQHIDEEQPVRQAGQRICHLCGRDVSQRPREPCGTAGAICHRRSPAAHPAKCAVPMKEPVLAVEMAASVLEIRIERVLHALDVRVVKTPQPLVGIGANVLFVVPEHRFPPRRPVDLVCRDVPVPEAVVCAPYRSRISLLALLQVGDRPLVRDVRVDAGQSDGEIDRLRDVVVRAKAERFDDVIACHPSGDHDDRQLGL